MVFDFRFYSSSRYQFDDDSGYNTEIENEIENDESYSDNNEIIDGKHYIGISQVIWVNEDMMCILGSTITESSFFKYPFEIIQRYMNDSIISSNPEYVMRNIDIIQLIIGEHQIYNVIIKTFWLKLIQRRWKRVIRERSEISRKRMHPTSRRIFEITGKYSIGLRIFPSLNGMLNDINLNANIH